MSERGGARGNAKTRATRVAAIAVVAVVSVFAWLTAASADARNPWKAKKKMASPKEHARAVQEGNYHLGEARRIQLAHDGQMTIARPVLEHARGAIAAYERALELSPGEPELHYRAVQAAQYIDDHRSNHGLCATCRDGYEAVVRHVDALRKADPLDPRDFELTWNVSLALSKLGGLGGPNAREYFDRAIAEYARWRRLADEANPDRAQQVGTGYSNCAELMMAVGRLEEAIEYYRAATDFHPNDALSWYGLAVALDRDGQWEKARASMLEALARDPTQRRLKADSVFFVPEGDIHYYEALALEVKGDLTNAISAYNRFLARSKGSLYVARAQQRLDEVKKRAAR
jgi:tetratricopeptide (TPR) repeat protein